MSRFLKVAWAGWLLLGACKADDPTQIVVSVSTDLAIPAELDTLELGIKRSSASRTLSFGLDPADSDSLKLPATLAINPGGKLSEKVDVEVKGLKSGSEVVKHRATVRFVENKILLLRAELLRSCAKRPDKCPSEQTCRADGCTAVEVNELPEYSEQEAFRPVADAGPLSDGASDSAADAASDARQDNDVVDAQPDAVVDGASDMPPGDTLIDQSAPDSTSCGDNTKNGTDECDADDYGTLTCEQLGFAGGMLKCTDKCKVDLSACDSVGFALISKGSFNMGSPATDPCRDATNEAQHWVTLTRPYEVATHEVTQQQFQDLMAENPAFFGPNGAGPDCGLDCPIETVSWYKAAAYCNKLSEGKALTKCYECFGTGDSTVCSEATAYEGQKVYDCPGYRLPTEAEWEHAYRAGSTTDLYPSAANTGTLTMGCSSSTVDPNADKIGWCAQNSNKVPHAVGLKAANAWGLYDMGGNVWEWCHDWYQEDLGTAAVTDPVGSCPYDCVMRAERGGSWSYGFSYMRAAQRGWGGHYHPDKETGFRCARTRSE